MLHIDDAALHATSLIWLLCFYLLNVLKSRLWSNPNNRVYEASSFNNTEQFNFSH